KAGPPANAGTSVGYEREGTAVVEDLGLGDREDARSDAMGCRRVPNDAGSYDLPGRGDDVRLFVVYRNHKVKAVRRQRAQDQLEVAERVRRYAYAGPVPPVGLLQIWPVAHSAVVVQAPNVANAHAASCENNWELTC